MRYVKSSYTVEEYVKKSRFIGFLDPCRSESEVHAILDQLRHRFPDASHIVYAYRIKSAEGMINRFSDAGEPGGTAGKPIFLHLEGKDLINACLAVVRYFGGVKLGTGGLVRAYGNTAKLLIEIADLQPFVEMSEVDMTIDYKALQTLEHALKKMDGEIIAQAFGETVRLKVRLPKQYHDDLLRLARLDGSIIDSAL